MKNIEKAKEIYDMLGQGRLLEAFDKHYHDDVVMKEVGEEPRVGKPANRRYEEKFLGMIKEFHGMGVDSITSSPDEHTTMVESWMEVTFQNDQKQRLDQVAVQKWLDGKVIEETFYHK